MTTGTRGTTGRPAFVAALGLVTALALGVAVAAADLPIASRELGTAAGNAVDGEASDGGPPGASSDAEAALVDDEGDDLDSPPTTDAGPAEPPAAQAPAQAPDPRDVMHYGGRYWAVLWVGGFDDPTLSAATEAIDKGWGPVWNDSEIRCNQGAAEALGVDRDARSVAVYFDTEREARQFAEQEGLPSQPTGHAQVTVHCLN